MATTEAIHKKVILRIWLMLPKALASSNEVWQYVNPDQTIKHRTTAPTRPTALDINPLATTLAQLTDPQMQDFKYCIDIYWEER